MSADSEPATAAPPSPPHSHGGHRWAIHGLWAAAVVVAALLIFGRSRVMAPGGAPANPRPVVVLMDSPLPGRVYNARTAAAGGTNADDLADALQPLPIATRKEITSATWHREEEVVRQNPDLIVSHVSCLLDARFAEPGQQGPLFEHLFDLSASRLVAVYGYVAASNPRTRFLVYSRGSFSPPERAARFVREAETRFPALRGRLHTFDVPGGREKATFRDPETARLVRERVRTILELQ